MSATPETTAALIQRAIEDVLEIVTVFSARMYGARSHKNKKLIDGVQQAVADVQGA